jgi:hypothetical protein
MGRLPDAKRVRDAPPGVRRQQQGVFQAIGRELLPAVQGDDAADRLHGDRHPDLAVQAANADLRADVPDGGEGAQDLQQQADSELVPRQFAVPAGRAQLAQQPVPRLRGAHLRVHAVRHPAGGAVRGDLLRAEDSGGEADHQRGGGPGGDEFGRVLLLPDLQQQHDQDGQDQKSRPLLITIYVDLIRGYNIMIQQPVMKLSSGFKDPP